MPGIASQDDAGSVKREGCGVEQDMLSSFDSHTVQNRGMRILEEQFGVIERLHPSSGDQRRPLEEVGTGEEEIYRGAGRRAGDPKAAIDAVEALYYTPAIRSQFEIELQQPIRAPVPCKRLERLAQRRLSRGTRQ